jgi:predicted transcriptional regulator
MRADSTRARMLAFFEANPDEELTVAQAAVKFSVTEAAVQLAAAELERAGRVERVKVIRRAGTKQ